MATPNRAVVRLVFLVALGSPIETCADSHALLVGCTKYPNLGRGLQLRGPANDVVLMRQLLTGRFGFPEDRIVTLSEQSGRRPTRANIESEFLRLGRVVRPGDRVVILLSGHGSQQPVPDPKDPDGGEPDGLDETFLPCDVGPWDGKKGKVVNAIVDDEIGAWLDAIASRGASLWLVVDACHSGTMARGGEDEVKREVPAEILVPAEALQRARQDAAARGTQSRGKSASLKVIDIPKGANDLVALYACQPEEFTVELPMPPDGRRQEPYGLLTYTMNQVLHEAAGPITYRELCQRIQARYVVWHPSYPNPMLEGSGVDREVLGAKSWQGRSQILLHNEGRDGARISVGSLHGMTAGSVLAVYPLAGERDADKLLGHVRVAETWPLDSAVVGAAFAGTPRRDTLPKKARCQLAFFSYGDLRLRVSVVADPGKTTGGATTRDRLLEQLKQVGGQEGSLVAVEQDRARAEWLVRLEGDRAYLLPAGGMLTHAESSPAASWFGPAPVDENLIGWLDERLRRIARAQNLLKMASTGSAAVLGAGDGANVELELVRWAVPKDGSGAQREVVPWQNGCRLREGELVGFCVTNRGLTAVDVTLLFVDSAYGITAMFPKAGDRGGNRLGPNQQVVPVRARVTKAAGKEHMVLIAVRAEPDRDAADFTCLAQSSLERARGSAGPTPGLDSPLGKLLQNALFAAGETRGLDTSALESYVVRRVTWEVIP